MSLGLKWKEYKQFLKMIAPLAIPIIIQNFLSSSLGMMDGIMISHVGDQAQSTINMAGVTQANRSFFMVMLFYFGIAAGASIFFSQFHGKKDYAGFKKILGVTITFGLIISLIPLSMSLFFSEFVMNIFVASHDEAVIQVGASFLKVMGLSYPIYILSWIYGFALRSIGNSKIYMYSSIITIFSNGILNYLLIYGAGPIPALGVVGAAWGTAIARVIEFLILFIYVYTRKSSPLKATFRELFSFRWLDFKQFLKTSVPVIFHEGFWGLGLTISFIIYGAMGRTTLAATGMEGPFVDFSFIGYFAVSQATAVIMGNMIGAHKPKEEIRATAYRCLSLGAFFSLFMMILLLFLPSLLIPIMYPVEQEAVDLAIRSLFAFEVLFLVRGIQIVGLVGVLRGSGDTLYGMVVDLFCMWCILVPMTYLTGIILGWSLPFVHLAGFSADLASLLLVLLRIRTNKWMKDVTYDTKVV